MVRKLQKTFIVSVVSALTLPIGVAPAFGASHEDLFDAYNVSLETEMLASQTLNTLGTLENSSQFDQMLQIASNEVGPQHGFDVDAAIAAALQEVGTSRATGWSQPGECIISAKRWITAGGGDWTTSGTPVSNYDNATRLPVSLAEPGDVIQYEHLLAPHAWVTGVHTVLVVGVNDDGTLHIVESNNPFGSGLVTQTEQWLPDPPAGFQAVAWRF